MLAFNDVQIQTDASWAISYVTDSGEDHISAVCAFDRPHSMIRQLLQNGVETKEDKLLTPTIRALGNIVTGTDQQTQACLDNVSLKSSLSNEKLFLGFPPNRQETNQPPKEEHCQGDLLGRV